MRTRDMDVQYIKGVGEKRAVLLRKLGINSVWDAVHYYPRAYLDFSVCTPIASLQPGDTACVRGVVGCPVSGGMIRQGMSIYKTVVTDGSDVMHLTIFNNKFLAQRLREGETYLFYGKVTRQYGAWEMTNPLVEDPDGNVPFHPVYPLTAGLSARQLSQIIHQALLLWSRDETGDLIPADIRRQYQLSHALFALKNIHEPATMHDMEVARRRLIFEELFVLQCGMALLRRHNRTKTRIRVQTGSVRDFLARLPFELTGAQKRAIDDCLRDFQTGDSMNRLVQGDVGSGKTVVAAAALWAMAKSGYQGAMMAPTEILAKQHAQTLQTLFGDALQVTLLTGGLTAKQKRVAKAHIADGTAQIVVGTHALLTEDVQFHALGLVVTDEQHRFGVRQRSTLGEKGDTPHVLVMSATPIPRTLSLIIYGDLDVSVIDELPKGRQKISTYAVDSSFHPRVYAFVRKLLDAGRQAYIVCPAVEETETDLLSAVSYAKELSEREFSAYRVGLLHGKMKPKEKQQVMADFAAGEIQLLVATTVIEVGIDVPNAVLMVVENAERFGLSQLHQLRGRVGRGSEKSYCILISDAQGETAAQRLEALCKTNDGFQIADADLRLRGPGDFFGARQHGLPQLQIADLLQDMETLQQARAASQQVIADDPKLQKEIHKDLKDAVVRLFQKNGAAALN